MFVCCDFFYNLLGLFLYLFATTFVSSYLPSKHTRWAVKTFKRSQEKVGITEYEDEGKQDLVIWWGRTTTSRPSKYLPRQHWLTSKTDDQIACKYVTLQAKTRKKKKGIFLLSHSRVHFFLTTQVIIIPGCLSHHIDSFVVLSECRHFRRTGTVQFVIANVKCTLQVQLQTILSAHFEMTYIGRTYFGCRWFYSADVRETVLA